MNSNIEHSGNNRLDGNDDLLDIKCVARHLSISTRGVWRAVARRDLSVPVKIGRCSRWFMSDVGRLRQRLKRQRGMEGDG